MTKSAKRSPPAYFTSSALYSAYLDEELNQPKDDDKGTPDKDEPKKGDGEGGGQGISETDDGDDDVVGETVAGSDEDGDDDGGVPIWLIVVIVIGLVLAGLAGRAFMRRRNEAA